MRRIVVTGANKGIGLAIATAILAEQQDTFVFLGARDPALGTAAIEGLVRQQASWRDRLMLLPLDVASDASVAAAASKLADTLARDHARLYAIVNNAGIGFPAGDIAAVLNVNILGVRRVCDALIPLLDPAAGRIVNIGSAAGPNFVQTCSPERRRFFVDPDVDWPSLQALIDDCIATGSDKAAFAEKGLGNGEPYGLSKACLHSYTMLLARTHPRLRINACSPGFIETDLTRKYAELQGKQPAELGMKPPSAGARAPMFLLFGEPEGNGRYYGSDAVRSPLDRYRSPGDPPYAGD
jgi:NAD(P)-dependent dehydrogenase (short-subunit alcohol dehydrogenase family)